MKKRILALGLVLALCLSGLPAAGAAQAAAPFPDVGPDHWACDAIRWALENGVTNGCEDGNFQPETAVSKVQFCAFLIRRFFPWLDQGDGDPWWEPYLDACSERNLLLNTSIWMQHQLEDPITRYDVAQVLNRVLQDKNIPAPEESEREAARAAISDWAEVPQKYQEAVETCYAMGLLNGLGDGSFGGDAYLDRAQVCAILQRLDSTVERLQPPAHIGQETTHLLSGGYTMHSCNPSTGVWTGWQGQDYGAWVDSQEEALATIESVIEQYPKHVVLFSDHDLGITTSDAPKLFEPYTYKYGIGEHHRTGYNLYFFQPSHSAGDYYEYRITFCRGAAGTIRMYQAGLLDELPTVDDTYWGGEELVEADFQPLLDTVEEIKETYGVDENSSEFDRAYACYRWITSHVSYDYELYYSVYFSDYAAQAEIYGRNPAPRILNHALIDGEGICEGYAMLYQALCCILHVNCVVTTGVALNHAWNMVQIDGQWYMADPTWDAGDDPANYQYFLIRTNIKARMDGTRLAEEQFSITGSTTDYPDTWRRRAQAEF